MLTLHFEQNDHLISRSLVQAYVTQDCKMSQTYSKWKNMILGKLKTQQKHGLKFWESSCSLVVKGV